MRDKYPEDIKKLPKQVKEAWRYRDSIHIILNPVVNEIEIANGLKILCTIEIPQINVDFNPK